MMNGDSKGSRQRHPSSNSTSLAIPPSSASTTATASTTLDPPDPVFRHIDNQIPKSDTNGAKERVSDKTIPNSNSNILVSNTSIMNNRLLPLNNQDVRHSNPTLSSFRPAFAQNMTVTRGEVLHALANRILYSSFYKNLYIALTIMSLFSLFISMFDPCPEDLLLVGLEYAINVALIVEVAIRFLAQRKMFFTSIFNIFDMVIVFLCFVTLTYLTFGVCSTGEAIADSILLLIRNGIQLSRLLAMLRMNSERVRNKPSDIDFSTISRGNSTNNKAGGFGFGLSSPGYQSVYSNDDLPPFSENLQTGHIPSNVSSPMTSYPTHNGGGAHLNRSMSLSMTNLHPVNNNINNGNGSTAHMNGSVNANTLSRANSLSLPTLVQGSIPQSYSVNTPTNPYYNNNTNNNTNNNAKSSYPHDDEEDFL